MTRDEFNKWKTGYFVAFPDAKVWLLKLEHPAATLETWFKCLSQCEARDVEEATERMIRGDLAPLEAYQREQTALHLRAYASRIGDDRKKRLKADRERTQTIHGKAMFRLTDGPSMSSMFTKICEFRQEAIDQGLTGSDINMHASDRLRDWLASNGREVAARVEGMPGEVGDAYEGEV